jgi:caffeoyl-CoA O-methyltransferase
LDLLQPTIDRYLDDLARPEDAILREMAARAVDGRFPYVGPQVGQLLLTLARSIGARRVLELGSGFGYSAYWFCQAVGPEGEVVLTEGSRQRADEAGSFLERGGFTGRTRILVGDALEVIKSVEGPFDIVFNDIDKQDYPRALEPSLALLRPGGLFISDNMLWMGQVLDARTEEPTTRGVLELTQALHDSPLFDTVLIPIRDGVTVSTYRAS